MSQQTHILVVDDEAEVRDMLAEYLTKHGFAVHTAADEVIERIVGLEMGADDYLFKPFDPRELLARIKSVLRRVTCPSPAPAALPDTVPHCVRVGRCLLNLETRTLRSLEGQEVPLTSMEFDLLQTFATHPNRVLSRDQLLELSHQRAWDVFDRSIDIRVTRLRRKIEVDPAKPQAIKTVRGVGYVFVPTQAA